MDLRVTLCATVFKVTENEFEDRNSHRNIKFYRAIVEQEGEAVTITCTEEVKDTARIGEENILECIINMDTKKMKAMSVLPFPPAREKKPEEKKPDAAK